MEKRKCLTHSDDILTSFETLKNDGRFCDFALKIGNEEIQVHRNVLAAASKYFDAMFSHDMEETKNGRVEMREIDLDSAKLCIDYIYTGKAMFSCENPKKLIFASELMQLHTLTDLYFQFLIEKISLENCLELMSVAHTHNKHTFKKVFQEFTVEHFEELVDSEAFFSVDENLLRECLASIKFTGPKVEIAKWEAITQWVEEDEKTRQNVFSELFQLVKLECLSDIFIKENISKHHLVTQSKVCLQMTLDALCSENRPLHAIVDKPGEPCIITCHVESRMIHRLNIKENKSVRVGRLPAGTFKNHFDIAYLNGEIYVVSGNTLCKLAAGRWQTLVKTKHEKAPDCCIVHGHSIFMAARDYTIEYNSRTNSFSETKTGHGLGEGFFAASNDEYIYGMGGKQTERKAMEFDFKTKTWEPIASMLFKRSQGAAVVFQGKLFAIGGYTYKAVELGEPSPWEVLYSPQTKPLQAAKKATPNLFGSPQTLSAFGSSGMFGSAPAPIKIDGSNKREIQTEVNVKQSEWYCPQADTWSQITETLPCDRFNFKIFNINDTLYMVGGIGKDRVEVLDLAKVETTTPSPNIDATHSCVA